MKTILENSIVVQFLCCLMKWYEYSKLATFIQGIQNVYAESTFRRLWDALRTSSFHDMDGSVYIRCMAALRHMVEGIGDVIAQSQLYRIALTISQKVSTVAENSTTRRVYHFCGMRGFLLIILALYLPVDCLLRSLPIGFVASAWDEGLIVLVVLYILWRTAMRRSPLQLRATPVDAYLLLFICVGAFLMCVNSPDFAIAVAGYRAVVQYMVWFFLVTRLIEDDHDFAIFYGTLVIMAILVGLHGIYQYIVAAPMPAHWISAMEQPVRTRVYSITGSPNIMGSFLVMFAPMVAAIAYYSEKMWVKTLAMCCTGMMCLSVLFTFSKGAWGGLVVAIVIFALLLDRRLIALMLGAGVASLIAIPSVMNRIAFLFTSAYRNASMRAGRMIRWETGWNLLQQNNPWLGFGLGRFGGAVAMQNQVISGLNYFYMDNYYLKTLVEMGYIGLFFYLLLLAALVLWCLRVIHRTKMQPHDHSKALAVGIFSGMCGVLAHSYFENIFEVPYMTAYFWALAGAVFYLGYFRKRRLHQHWKGPSSQ